MASNCYDKSAFFQIFASDRKALNYSTITE